MGSGLALRALGTGLKQLSEGKRPSLRDAVLTQGNITRLTSELARMRGAAMKLGQLISMDAGDFLPPELADILSRLRAEADFMPVAQLQRTLRAEWGEEWRRYFQHFDMQPIAAASIGQVHRATAKDGTQLAVKVQYPGIARAIDSDLDNVAALFRLSGYAPPAAQLDPLLEEARQQLQAEADYTEEAHHVRAFATLLENDTRFAVPEIFLHLCTNAVLTMSFATGEPIEHAIGEDQGIRDRLVEDLIRLTLRELFHFQTMQTDPNLANYTYDPQTGTIGLLDFGATRHFSDGLVGHYQDLLRAGLRRDRDAMWAAFLALGFANDATTPAQRDLICALSEEAFAALLDNPIYDFGQDRLLESLRERAFALATDTDFTATPPIDVLLIQRKLGGLYLLARRLKVTLPVASLLGEFVGER